MDASAGGAPLSFQQLTAWLENAGKTLLSEATRPQLLGVLQGFVSANENPAVSPNFRSRTPDRLDAIVQLLRSQALDLDNELCLLVLKTLKILSRKEDSRRRLDEPAVRSIVRVLQVPGNARIAGEGANVVLNICYEKANVEAVLKAQGVAPLVGFLKSKDSDLQANAAGAIQSICFQGPGRLAVRDGGAIPAIVELLHSANTKVLTRAVGALHNLSSDSDSIRLIRRQGGIARLIELLRSPNAAVFGSAAGALQNVSREVASRRLIKDAGAAVPLADLLLGADVQAQVCAAGALLNILGPELGDDAAASSDRRAFGRLLSCALSLAMVREALFGGAGGGGAAAIT